jgi:AhpD family alkylhydroperoxidase
MTIQARMNHPVYVIPAALQALRAVSQTAEHSDLPPDLAGLVKLRASQINGCSVCVTMHAHELKQLGESDDRIFAVAAWRDTPYFSDAERAALALAEALTRLSDRPEAVSDEIWDQAARHFNEPALAALILSIAMINVWNRLNAAVRQVAGAKWSNAPEPTASRAA